MYRPWIPIIIINRNCNFRKNEEKEFQKVRIIINLTKMSFQLYYFFQKSKILDIYLCAKHRIYNILKIAIII